MTKITITNTDMLKFVKAELSRREYPKTDKRRNQRKIAIKYGLLAYKTSDLEAFLLSGSVPMPKSDLSKTDRNRKAAQRAFTEVLATAGLSAAYKAYKQAITA